MAFAEDLAPYFDLDGFAQAAQLAGREVHGIFTDAQAIGAVGIGMAAPAPVFVCASADAAGSIGQSLTLQDGRTYIVAAQTPDGTGISTLELEQP